MRIRKPSRPTARKSRAFKMAAECADTSNPAACMAVLAGTAKALSKHNRSDPADAIMQLVWAAAHIARQNGVPPERLAEMLGDAIPYAVTAERDLAAQDRLQ